MYATLSDLVLLLVLMPLACAAIVPLFGRFARRRPCSLPCYTLASRPQL